MGKNLVTYENGYYYVIESQNIGNKIMLTLKNRDTAERKRVKLDKNEYDNLIATEKNIIESFMSKPNEIWKPADKRPWMDSPEILAYYLFNNSSSLIEALSRVYYGQDVCTEEFMDKAKEIITEKFTRKDEQIKIETNYDIAEEVGKVLKQPSKSALQEITSGIVEAFTEKFKAGNDIMLDMLIESLSTKNIIIKNYKYGNNFNKQKIDRKELVSIIESAPDDMVKSEINKYVSNISLTDKIKTEIKDIRLLVDNIKNALSNISDSLELIYDDVVYYKIKTWIASGHKESWLVFDYSDLSNLRVYGYINNQKNNTMINKSHIANFVQLSKFLKKYEISIRIPSEDEKGINKPINDSGSYKQPILDSK
jgi:hypothetical protein